MKDYHRQTCKEESSIVSGIQAKKIRTVLYCQRTAAYAGRRTKPYRLQGGEESI